jgi:glycosyltransferase involved in cell wall biosynthesis
MNSLGGGGTERTLLALLRAFDTEPIKHIVVTLREAGCLSAQLPGHVACRPLAVRGRSRTAWLTLTRLLRAWQADVIHARNTGCWTDAVLAGLMTRGVRVVLGFHGLQTREPFDRRRRRIVAIGMRAGARFTSVSEAGRRQLCEQASVTPNRIEVLPNGVDLFRFADPDEAIRESIRCELGYERDAFVIGAVGSLTPVKRHDVLLSAFARAAKTVKNIRLLLVGDGPLRATLTGQARTEGVEDRVTFAGTCEDVPALLAGMDVHVCTSESEGMNNALLEAMAAGLPVIATDVGDNALVVRDGVEGRIIQSGSWASLADAIVQLDGAPEMRSRFAEAARIRAKQYDFQKTVRMYEQYYRGLIAEPVTGPLRPIVPSTCQSVS